MYGRLPLITMLLHRVVTLSLSLYPLTLWLFMYGGDYSISLSSLSPHFVSHFLYWRPPWEQCWLYIFVWVIMILLSLPWKATLFHFAFISSFGWFLSLSFSLSRSPPLSLPNEDIKQRIDSTLSFSSSISYFFFFFFFFFFSFLIITIHHLLLLLLLLLLLHHHHSPFIIHHHHLLLLFFSLAIIIVIISIIIVPVLRGFRRIDETNSLNHCSLAVLADSVQTSRVPAGPRDGSDLIILPSGRRRWWTSEGATDWLFYCT